MKKERQKIAVAMSGGVDSSVTAVLLKERGYDVSGAFIRGWYPKWLSCTWREDRQDAMRACATLGIPFFTIDLSKEYKEYVVAYMIDEYQSGRTPNPDVMCNKMIKFGSFIKKMEDLGFNIIATGHHARIFNNSATSSYKLFTGTDTTKDQSYFLWTLTQNILKRTLFPVGEYTKKYVRELAKKYKLHNAEKKDSQGLCFIGHLDMREFLKHYISVESGDVLNENGLKIGKHEGAILYTTGQRHGFDVLKKNSKSGPWYVIEKDIHKNTITVAESYKTLDSFGVESVVLKETNWISGEPKSGKGYRARIRYRQPLQNCTIEKKDSWIVVFEEKQKGVANGQSCVLYDKEECLGGGVIYPHTNIFSGDVVSKT